LEQEHNKETKTLRGSLSSFFRQTFFAKKIKMSKTFFIIKQLDLKKQIKAELTLLLMKKNSMKAN
jgi:hypothetical protein